MIRNKYATTTRTHTHLSWCRFVTRTNSICPKASRCVAQIFHRLQTGPDRHAQSNRNTTLHFGPIKSIPGDMRVRCVIVIEVHKTHTRNCYPLHMPANKPPTPLLLHCRRVAAQAEPYASNLYSSNRCGAPIGFRTAHRRHRRA